MSIKKRLEELKKAQGVKEAPQKVVQLPVGGKTNASTFQRDAGKAEAPAVEEPVKDKGDAAAALARIRKIRDSEECAEAYEADVAERKAESEELDLTIHKDSVWKLDFGTIVSPKRARHADGQDGGVPLPDEFDDPNVEDVGHIMFLGRSPKGQRGGLRAVGSPDDVEDGSLELYRLLEHDGLPAMGRNSLPLEDGPYADKDGVIAEVAKEIKGKTLRETIERTIDVFRFDFSQVDIDEELEYPRAYPSEVYRFGHAREFDELPDVASTAGNILSAKARKQDLPGLGKFFILTHLIEPYLLATAALRRNNVPAYTAFGIKPKGGQELSIPLIAIIDLTKTVPLITFPFIRKAHPSMTSIEILSDVAMQGMAHALWAETRVKHLTKELIDRAAERKEYLSEGEIDNQLVRIARQLFECYRRWPGSHFVDEALGFAEENLTMAYRAMKVIEMKNWLITTHPGIGPHLEADTLGTMMSTLSQFHPDILAEQNPEIWQQEALMVGRNYTHQIQHQFTLRMARAIAAAKEKE